MVSATVAAAAGNGWVVVWTGETPSAGVVGGGFLCNRPAPERARTRVYLHIILTYVSMYICGRIVEGAQKLSKLANQLYEYVEVRQGNTVSRGAESSPTSVAQKRQL